MNLYNNYLTRRWNEMMRKAFILPKMRRELKNHDFSILCNNCNGGVISHDLGLRFNSPTVNLFFAGDGFYTFCEDLKYYLNQPLVAQPSRKSGAIEYPVFSLGIGERKIELHFLHYHSYREAVELWERRKKRFNPENYFIVMAFFDKADEERIKRFEELPHKNKIIFTERNFPQYKHSFCIKGFPNGLGVLNLYNGLLGHRKMDAFDFVYWFNTGSFRRNY